MSFFVEPGLLAKSVIWSQPNQQVSELRTRFVGTGTANKFVRGAETLTVWNFSHLDKFGGDLPTPAWRAKSSDTEAPYLWESDIDDWQYNNRSGHVVGTPYQVRGYKGRTYWLRGGFCLPDVAPVRDVAQYRYISTFGRIPINGIQYGGFGVPVDATPVGGWMPQFYVRVFGRMTLHNLANTSGDETDLPKARSNSNSHARFTFGFARSVYRSGHARCMQFRGGYDNVLYLPLQWSYLNAELSFAGEAVVVPQGVQQGDPGDVLCAAFQFARGQNTTFVVESARDIHVTFHVWRYAQERLIYDPKLP